MQQKRQNRQKGLRAQPGECSGRSHSRRARSCGAGLDEWQPCYPMRPRPHAARVQPFRLVCTLAHLLPRKPPAAQRVDRRLPNALNRLAGCAGSFARLARRQKTANGFDRRVLVRLSMMSIERSVCHSRTPRLCTCSRHEIVRRRRFFHELRVEQQVEASSDDNASLRVVRPPSELYVPTAKVLEFVASCAVIDGRPGCRGFGT